MRTTAAALFASSLLLFSGLCVAANEKGAALKEMIAATSMGTLGFMTRNLSQTQEAISKAQQDIDDAKAALEKAVVPAVKEAGKNAELAKAAKEFYTAARAYFSADGTTLARTNMDTKEAQLELEMKLAGMMD